MSKFAKLLEKEEARKRELAEAQKQKEELLTALEQSLGHTTLELLTQDEELKVTLAPHLKNAMRRRDFIELNMYLKLIGEEDLDSSVGEDEEPNTKRSEATSDADMTTAESLSADADSSYLEADPA